MGTDGPLIAIEGGVAAGKSTTAAQLAQRIGWRYLPEDFDGHPVLPTFYEDPRRYGLENELIFFGMHYHQLNLHRDDRPMITDFSLTNDLSFVRMIVDQSAQAMFDQLHDTLLEQAGRPDLTIYLDVPPKLRLERVRRRNRPYEQGITAGYLAKLHRHYLDEQARLGTEIIHLTISEDDSPKTVTQRALSAVRERFPELAAGSAA